MANIYGKNTQILSASATRHRAYRKAGFLTMVIANSQLAAARRL